MRAELLVLFPLILSSQSLIINEVLSSNQGSLYDEDGDTPDWIEIYNAGGSAVNLQDFGLSDDMEDEFKWTFEDTPLGAGDHLLVHASGKDRQPLRVNWDLIIEEGDIWRYFVGSSEPPADWKEADFNDVGWDVGPTGIGYGDDDDNTVIPTTLSVYLRHSFEIPDLNAIEAVLFHMDFDDGYIAYLNGVEIARVNLGAPGEYASHTSTSDTWIEASLYQGLDLPGMLVDAELLTTESNVLAIQVHNHSLGSSDLTSIPFLSLGVLDGTVEDLPPYLKLPSLSEYHTNFQVSSSGELLLLSGPDGTLIDSLTIPALLPDISYGHEPDGEAYLFYFAEPTPGNTNTGGYASIAYPPTVSPVPGFYSGGISVTLESQSPGTTLYYTLNGSEPTTESPEYSTALYFTGTTILRVLATNPGGLASPVSSYSYFINETPNLPVISLIFEPGDFFDEETGIYVPGLNASPEFPHFGANFWEDWERPIHLEYFEDGNTLSYAAPAGVKIFGGWSRGFPQRSLSLFARNTYGVSEFQYPFFAEIDLDSFEALVLRNSGNDWNYTSMRDGFMTGLVLDREVEVQAFQPVEVYLNGEYWGLYNLREKTNEHFVAAHSGQNVDNVDLLELDGQVIHGDNSQYHDLIQYVESNDLSIAEHYEYVKDRIDIDAFIDYQVSQIFFDNRDWPGNNIKFWRPRIPGGKWRWIMFDTDFGFGIWNPYAYQDNTLEFATDPWGPEWPNPPWSTLLLRKLLENEDFRTEFILTTCDLVNSNLSTGAILDAIDMHHDWISSAIPDHFNRWNHNSVNNWNNQVGVLEHFAQFRPAYMRLHTRLMFDLGPLKVLALDVEPTSTGLIRVHSIVPDDYPWTGHYYQDIPIDLEAVPAPGHVFSHWVGIEESASSTSVTLNDNLALSAIFEPAPSGDSSIVINEINYHSPDAQDAADWLELYNRGETAINLNGWYFRDQNDDNRFDLPAISLAGGEYLVLCHDSLLIRAVHGDDFRLAGNFDFNLSNGGELVRLYRYDDVLIDTVQYDDEDPWPTEPDGDGPTLELIYPGFNNALAESWAVSDFSGTPGRENSRYQEPAATEDQQIPQTFVLHDPYPNPFNDRLSIPVSIPDPGAVDMMIYDIRGHLVHAHRYPYLTPGRTTLHWDGRSDDGKELGTGVYFLHLMNGSDQANQKIVLIK